MKFFSLVLLALGLIFASCSNAPVNQQAHFKPFKGFQFIGHHRPASGRHIASVRGEPGGPAFEGKAAVKKLSKMRGDANYKFSNVYQRKMIGSASLEDKEIPFEEWIQENSLNFKAVQIWAVGPRGDEEFLVSGTNSEDGDVPTVGYNFNVYNVKNPEGRLRLIEYNFNNLGTIRVMQEMVNTGDYQVLAKKVTTRDGKIIGRELIKFDEAINVLGASQNAYAGSELIREPVTKAFDKDGMWNFTKVFDNGDQKVFYVIEFFDKEIGKDLYTKSKENFLKY